MGQAVPSQAAEASDGGHARCGGSHARIQEAGVSLQAEGWKLFAISKANAMLAPPSCGLLASQDPKTRERQDGRHTLHERPASTKQRMLMGLYKRVGGFLKYLGLGVPL